MILLSRILLALTLTGASAAPVLAADAAAVAEAKAALQTAVNGGRMADVLEARARFAALAAAEPSDPALHYWVAVADWRAAGLAQNEGKDVLKRQCEAGIASAERAVELAPKSGEALAMLVGIRGMSLSYRGAMAGMTLGPRLERDLERAHGLASDNPRVHLMDAVNTYHKPGFVGGGAKNALPILERAIALFETERVTDPAAADWGRDDAHLWAGRCAMKLGDYATAKRHFERTLELNPDNGWTKRVLLPKAEQALAKAAAKERS